MTYNFVSQEKEFILNKFLKKYNLSLTKETKLLKKEKSESFLRIAMFTDKINSILENNGLNNVEKQKELENLANPFLRKSENFQYLFAGTLLGKTKLLQQDLFSKENSLDHDIRILSKSELKQTSGERKLRALGKEKTDFYVKYNKMLKFFNTKENETAFTVIMSISSSYSSVSLDMETISKELLEFVDNSNLNPGLTKALNKTVSLEFMKKLGSMKRTSFIMKLASAFYLKYKTLYNFEKNPELKEDICFELSNKELIYLALQLEFLLIKHKIIEYDMFENSDEYTNSTMQVFSEIEKQENDLEEKEDLEFFFFSNRFYAIKVCDDILENLLKLEFFSSSIPMVEKPLDWKNEPNSDGQTFCYNSSSISYKLKQVVKIVLSYGGLFSNKSNLFTAVHSKDKRSYSWVPKDIVKNINYLQGQAFQINESTFSFIKQDIFLALKEFLFEKDHNIIDIIKYENNILYLYNFSEYLNSQLEKVIDKESFVKDQKKVQICLNNYLTLYESVVEFFFIIELADVLRKRKLFFQAFFDNRGRIYTHGYPLSPQGNCLSKFLLDFYTENVVEETVKLREFTQQELNQNRGSDFFEYVKTELNLKSYISLDASCSGISIISGLIGYKLGLIKTNVLTELQEGEERKEDYYSLILDKIKRTIADDIQKAPKGLDASQSLRLLGYCFTRDFVKRWVIRYIYGETGFTRYKELQDVFYKRKKRSCLRENDELSDFEKALIKKYSFEFNQFICLEVNEFVQFLKNSFNEIKTDEKPYIKICSKANLKSFFSIIYISIREKSKMKWRYLFSSVVDSEEKILKESQFIYYKVTDKLDSRKLNRTILSHFIHHLDSVLLNNVVKQCRKQNLKIFTAHDCFMVESKNVEKLKVFYKNAFVEELFLNDPIKAFLLENSGKPLTSLIELQLIKYKKNIELLLSEIRFDSNLPLLTKLRYNLQFILN